MESPPFQKLFCLQRRRWTVCLRPDQRERRRVTARQSDGLVHESLMQNRTASISSVEGVESERLHSNAGDENCPNQ